MTLIDVFNNQYNVYVYIYIYIYKTKISYMLNTLKEATFTCFHCL